MLELILSIVDVSSILFLIIFVINWFILIHPKAEDVWWRDGSGYTKGSTRGVRRRIVVYIVVSIMVFVISNLIREVYIL